MTDFSFRSTAIGIPFATEEGEVTVYDCPEASRYTVFDVHIHAESTTLLAGVWILINAHHICLLYTPAVVSVCRLRMPVAGASTTSSAVEHLSHV